MWRILRAAAVEDEKGCDSFQEEEEEVVVEEVVMIRMVETEEEEVVVLSRGLGDGRRRRLLSHLGVERLEGILEVAQRHMNLAEQTDL